MTHVFEYLFVFAFCSTAGWVLEVVYRSSKKRKFVNPGFMTGCCLPIYGTGGTAMYVLCRVSGLFIGNTALRYVFIIGVGAAVMTLIELVSGLLCLKYYHLRLWDYTKRPLNYKGVICVEFSLVWAVCCAVYVFFADPWLSSFAPVLSAEIFWIFAIGIYYGIFIVDMSESIDLLTKIKRYASHIAEIVDVEKLKEQFDKHRLHMPHLYIFGVHGLVKEDLKHKAEEIRNQATKKIGDILHK